MIAAVTALPMVVRFFVQENGPAPAPDAASNADLEVLLDLLAVPDLRAEVRFWPSQILIDLILS